MKLRYKTNKYKKYNKKHTKKMMKKKLRHKAYKLCKNRKLINVSKDRKERVKKGYVNIIMPETFSFVLNAENMLIGK